MSALFVPADVDEANASWTANCGPCALAALLGLPVASVRQAFSWYPERPWCSPTQMLSALSAMGHRAALQQHKTGDRAFVDGLAYVQFTGPWTSARASARWAYRHTHWVAVAHGGHLVYDANTDRWASAAWWSRCVVPVLLEDTPRADGGWWVRTTVRVAR